MLKQKVMLMVLILVVGMAGSVGADLIGLYEFEGDFIDTSESDTVFDGTPTATAPSFITDTPRGTGQAVEFVSGTGLNCGNVAGEGLDVTLSYWIKETAGTSQFCIPINKWAGSDVAGLFGYGILLRGGGENNSMLFRMANYQSYGGWGSELRTSDNAYALDKWNHLVFTYVDATDTATAYLNGVFDAEMTGIQDREQAGAANKLDDLLMGSLTSEGFQGMLDEVAIWDNALTADEALDLYELGPQPAGAKNPDPQNRSTVGIANPLTLSWTNMDPNYPGGDTYVDVLWGTEPNALHPAYDMAVPIIAGESIDSTEVDSLAVDTYYWRVDSYIYGADNINEPNRIEGPLWMYTTSSDAAPTVEIVTLDQMTWAGEGVPLDATVTDDDESPVTIEWTADLPAGLSAAFDPGNGVADTTVTLTRVPYSEASITNAGFEDEVLDDGAWGGAPGWSGVGDDAGGGSWNPGAAGTDNPGYGGVAPEGSNIAYVGFGADSTGGGIAQVLAEMLASDTEYTLTVEVGDSPLYDWPGYKVQLLAGGTVLAEDDDTVVITDNQFTTVTVPFDSTGVDPELVGEPLEIRLLVVNSSPDGWLEMNFDDVRLTADPPFNPTWIQTATVTITVSDEFNPEPDTASIEIDVYNDACQMAKVGQGKSAITDFNANCITGLEDLAVIAAAWLDDYSATGPADL